MRAARRREAVVPRDSTTRSLKLHVVEMVVTTLPIYSVGMLDYFRVSTCRWMVDDVSNTVIRVKRAFVTWLQINALKMSSVETNPS